MTCTAPVRDRYHGPLKAGRDKDQEPTTAPNPCVFIGFSLFLSTHRDQGPLKPLNLCRQGQGPRASKAPKPCVFIGFSLLLSTDRDQGPLKPLNLCRQGPGPRASKTPNPCVSSTPVTGHVAVVSSTDSKIVHRRRRCCRRGRPGRPRRRRPMQAQCGRGRGMQGLLHTHTSWLVRSNTTCPKNSHCTQASHRTQDKVYITHGSLAYIHRLEGLLKTLLDTASTYYTCIPRTALTTQVSPHSSYTTSDLLNNQLFSPLPVANQLKSHLILFLDCVSLCPSRAFFSLTHTHTLNLSTAYSNQS